MKPYGVKAAELQAVDDMVKTVSLVEAEYFSCATEGFSSQVSRGIKKAR